MARRRGQLMRILHSAAIIDYLCGAGCNSAAGCKSAAGRECASADWQSARRIASRPALSLPRLEPQ